MNARFIGFPFFLIMGLLVSFVFPIRSDAVNVSWDSDHGFSPAAVTINLGDTVIWVDNDDTFPTQVTSDNSIFEPNYFQFYLVEEGDTYSFTFDSTGTIGYSDGWGHSGSITINSLAPTSITLISPRLAEGQFLFDATGLTVGETNVLEISTNLSDWTAIETNVAAASSATFTNPAVAGSQFYRVVQMP